jgi:epoxyqueuosine reductase
LSLQIELTEFRRAANEQGLLLQGWSQVTTLGWDQQRLRSWQSADMMGEMRFMARDPSLLCNPQMLLSSARTIASFLIPYSGEKTGPCPVGYGRVARYAWGRDYHSVLRKRLKRLVATLRSQLGPALEARAWSDAVPLLERAWAQRAGLGFIGKNTMLIRPRVGSFTLIADLVMNVEISEDEKTEGPPAARASCGSCQRCLNNCPTGAIVEPYRIDARKCISYLNIEKTGMLAVPERKALGDWLLGCDICQEVCPFNHDPALPELSELSAAAGSGPFLKLSELLQLRSDQEFLARFAGTPLMRPGREGILRNAACVAVNSRVFDLLPVLIATAQEDSSPLLRAHALFAVVELGRLEGGSSALRAQRLLESMQVDSAPQVVNERQRLVASVSGESTLLRICDNAKALTDA